MLTRRQLLKNLVAGAVAARLPGSRATAIDHISYQSRDYKKTRDFYANLLGFQAADQDENQLFLWAGETLISAKNTPAVKTPTMDHVGFTIEPWNFNTVQGALKDRGLSVRVNSNDPHDPAGTSMFTLDPNGYTVQLCQKLVEGKPAPSSTRAPLQVEGINHISYQCLDYKKTCRFYTDLLDVPTSNDRGDQAYLRFGNGFLAVRNGANGVIDHFGWTISDWNVGRVVDELKKYGLEAQPDGHGTSVATRDINGYPLELCSKDFAAGN